MQQLDDELRQGDLVLDVPFPTEKSAPDENGVISWPTERKAGIVIEQCCVIEQQQVVRLARLTVRRPNENLRRLLTMEDPSVAVQQADGQGFLTYPVRFICLVAHPQLPSLPESRVYLAEFFLTVGYSGDFIWLREYRVGRMTAHARRVLRTKLALLAGRAEADDVAELAAGGEGAAPYPA